MQKHEAIGAFANRVNNPVQKIDNSSLHAGSPMYFYCVHCGHLADTLPEEYTPAPGVPKKECAYCKELVDNGWLDEAKKAAKA
jgi:hypothetical protein